MEIPYGPTNTKALDLIPAERQKIASDRAAEHESDVAAER